MNGVTHVPFPDPYRPILDVKPGEDYGETVVRYIEEQILGQLLPPEDVAGILVEPIQGEGGYVVPTPGFFPALRELCDQHDILLIVDEVQSGMGRTGKWWAIEHFGVEPDIVCAAKGIASGMPLGVMFAKEHHCEMAEGRAWQHLRRQPDCLRRRAGDDRADRERVYAKRVEMGDYLIDILKRNGARHPCIGDVRGKGLMIGIEFVKDPRPKTRCQAA